MNFLLCVLFLAIVPLTKCCEDGWTQFGDYCYKRGSVKIQVDSIQSYCQALGANIISITSEAEKDFIASLTKTGLSTPMYLQPLIGAYRDSETSPWKWRDGTVFAQSNWFFQDKITKDRNCAYLLVDKTVDVFGRGSTNPKDIYHNGNTGGFSTGHCTNIGNVVICKKRDTTDRRTEKMCGSTWAALDSSCYKYFSEPNIQIGQANDYCKRHGANLVSITTEKEKEFLISITTKSQYAPVNWQTAVGCYRDSSNRWKWYDGTPFEQSSFFYPVQNDTDNCCMLLSDVPTRIGITLLPKPEHFYFNQVTGKILKAKCSWPAYQFICEKKACDLSISTFSNGRCECNKGYVDITETTSLEASKYQKGEKCIPDRCRVKDDTSVLFMLDSSDSITVKHWPKLVNFVTDAATELPTSYRIGFLRFSTNVTFEKFVKPGWNVKQIKEAVPTLYEAGGTNTPAALKHAQKIFEDVRSKNKIAVLITDGLPFAEKEYDSEAEALDATVRAAEELREDGVRLIVMGVGPKICDNAEEVKKWVRNPKQDYFLLRHSVKSLKSKDMEKLLKIVCN